MGFEDFEEQGDEREASEIGIPPWLERGLRDMHPTVRMAVISSAYRMGKIDGATARALLEMQCARRGRAMGKQPDRESEVIEAEALARMAERERIAAWLLERSKRADTMVALIALRKAAVELAEGAQ